MKIETDFASLKEFVVVDLETTGFNPQSNRIVEICLIKVDGSNLRLDQGGQTKLRTETILHRINPTVSIPRSASRVHGISDQDVAGSPTFADISGEVRAFLADLPIVSHNVAFDTEFLDYEFARAKSKPIKTNRRLCTMLAVHERASLKAGKKVKWPKLSESGPYVGVSFQQSVTHSASEDATNCLRLAVGLMTTYIDPTTRLRTH
jgi:DNA polymerase III epsilon subunit-like protein